MSEPNPIELAEQLVSDAEAALEAARTRLAEHDALIAKTAAALASLDADIETALARPDKGAGWRKTRAALAGEAEGLALQRAVLIKPVAAAEAAVRAAERTLAGAREDDLTRRVAEAEAGLRPHAVAIAAAWKLHCLRYKGGLSDSRSSFVDWLLHPEIGLFDLENLMMKE